MTYDSEKREMGREHFYVVEIDLDYCSLTQSVSPCTATETGDAKCFNTIGSCNDIPNYTKTTKTYRFCSDRSPHPIGLDAIPSISSISVSAGEIDISGGLGKRASVTINFDDHPHNDKDVDKYTADRTYIALERGLFWQKLRARNPNYHFKALRVLSGYLVDGVFDAVNFQTSHFVVDRLDVSNGRAIVVAKDPLKLADRKKGQAPKASSGTSQSALNTTDTTITLLPSGVGNDEYPSSGKIAMKGEVMTFTRSGDILTVVRGQENTIALTHSAGDTVQLCLEYSGQLNTIIKDLLVNYLDFPTAFIPDSTWQSEVDTYLNGAYDALITKPVDVNKLLKELSESAPHYLWWDERQQILQLTVLKEPPESANVLNMDQHLIKNSVTVKDLPKMRVSTVFIHFGLFDPTKKLDEHNNFSQTYVRVDTDSISKNESSLVKVIESRWISNTNKAAALRAAALIGRRFASIPREITFSLDAKDSDVWLGQTKEINHRDLVDFTGNEINTQFQILSGKESGVFQYKALEYNYGGSLPEDEGGGDPTVDLIVLGADVQNFNLRTEYDIRFPSTPPDATTKVKVIIQAGVVVGSSDTASFSFDTGSFPTGAYIEVVVYGHIVGKGGDGQDGLLITQAPDGGDAITLNHPISLNNFGVIGGGGGGGGSAKTAKSRVAGGGGAGSLTSLGGSNSQSSETGAVVTQATDGNLETGGAGGKVVVIGVSDPIGGSGGELGQDGNVGFTISGTTYAGGNAGRAIVKNGKTLTYITTGDIRGAVV